jgi:predicted phosphodiesterase
MRTAVLSDIHGNLPALEAVVADAESRGCSAFVNLGDILSGPLWPRETADYLMARDWITIAGNHERQLLNDGPDRIGPSDRYAREALDQRHIEWLRSLPATWQLSADIFLCHGTPTSDLTYFLEEVAESGIRGATRDEVRERASGREKPLILCGHSHVARVVDLGDGRAVANPGSVGLQAYASDHPRPHVVENGSPLARYGILDGLEFTPVEIPYDHESAAARAGGNDRPDWAAALRAGRMYP